jgi:hypothetical protein
MQRRAVDSKHSLSTSTITITHPRCIILPYTCIPLPFPFLRLLPFALFRYKPIKHGRPGIGGTKSAMFVPLK